jgi:hypothetical protein
MHLKSPADAGLFVVSVNQRLNNIGLKYGPCQSIPPTIMIVKTTKSAR